MSKSKHPLVLRYLLSEEKPVEKKIIKEKGSKLKFNSAIIVFDQQWQICHLSYLNNEK